MISNKTIAELEQENVELQEQLDADQKSFINVIKELHDKNEALAKELAATKLTLQQEHDCAAGIKLCPACEKEELERTAYVIATQEWEENRRVR